MKKIIAGDITLYQKYCPGCKDKTLLNSPFSKCKDCGYDFNESTVKGFNILVKPERRKLSSDFKKQTLEIQENKCFWCNRNLKGYDQYITRKNKIRKLLIHYDHVKPFIFSGNNEDDNIVASCSMCNLWKSKKVFKTIEECRKYLLNKWKCEIKNGIIEEL